VCVKTCLQQSMPVDICVHILHLAVVACWFVQDPPCDWVGVDEVIPTVTSDVKDES